MLQFPNYITGEQLPLFGGSALVIHGITDPAILETIACREGLSLAQDLMLQNFVLASDSKQVVDDIKKSSQGAHGAIITEIRQRLLLFNCNITFEGRTANKDADRLAKFAQSLDQGRHVWFDTPHDPFCIPHHVDFE